MLRCIVIGTGIAAMVGGVIAIAGLPFAPSWRSLWAALWTIAGCYELKGIAARNRRYRLLRIEQDGNMQLMLTNGCCMPATLSAGSVVLGSFAWLRFTAENGCRHVELFRRECPGDKDWRRLQVIWRHLGAGR
jgi:hypothetical protein